MHPVLGPLLPASALRLTGRKGVDHEQPPTKSTSSSQPAIRRGSMAN
jgi:hypothetical protein